MDKKLTYEELYVLTVLDCVSSPEELFPWTALLDLLWTEQGEFHWALDDLCCTSYIKLDDDMVSICARGQTVLEEEGLR